MKYILLAVLFLSGCAKVKTLNMNPHQFSQKHEHIVWMQIAGFAPEHLAMVRFGRDSADDKSALEFSQCVGSAWSFNLFTLRPSADLSFASQMTGRKNITGDCSDYQQPMIWHYLDRVDYISGIYESEGSSSLLQSRKCPGDNQLLHNTYFWKMGKRPEEMPQLFYSNVDQEPFSAAGVYFDDSCQTGVCFSSSLANVQSVYPRFVQGKGKTLFIYRDFSLQQALLKKDGAAARDALTSIDQLYEYFVLLAKKNPRTLVLLTGAAALPVEFPHQGKEWEQFDLKGKNITFKKESLLSPVFSFGAGAENFCGMMEESEIFKRILWTPDQSQLEVDIKNILN